jgi:hypothetical protein
MQDDLERETGAYRESATADRSIDFSYRFGMAA